MDNYIKKHWNVSRFARSGQEQEIARHKLAVTDAGKIGTQPPQHKKQKKQAQSKKKTQKNMPRVIAFHSKLNWIYNKNCQYDHIVFSLKEIFCLFRVSEAVIYR